MPVYDTRLCVLAWGRQLAGPPAKKHWRVPADVHVLYGGSPPGYGDPDWDCFVMSSEELEPCEAPHGQLHPIESLLDSLKVYHLTNSVSSFPM